MTWRAALVLALLPACLWARSGERPASCPQDHSAELGLQEDVLRYTACTQVAGIVIRTGGEVDVSVLRKLEVITGDLTIGPTVAVDEIALSGLLRVGGTIRVSNNGMLGGVFLPRLEHAGRIEVDNNAVLTTVSVPRLTAVDGALVITDNAALELVSASSLTTVGQELVIAGQGRLTLLEMGNLASAGAVRIERTPKLPAEVVDRLTRKSALAVPPSP